MVGVPTHVASPRIDIKPTPRTIAALARLAVAATVHCPDEQISSGMSSTGGGGIGEGEGGDGGSLGHVPRLTKVIESPSEPR